MSIHSSDSGNFFLCFLLVLGRLFMFPLLKDILAGGTTCAHRTPHHNIYSSCAVYWKKQDTGKLSQRGFLSPEETVCSKLLVLLDRGTRITFFFFFLSSKGIHTLAGIIIPVYLSSQRKKRSYILGHTSGIIRYGVKNSTPPPDTNHYQVRTYSSIQQNYIGCMLVCTAI